MRREFRFVFCLAIVLAVSACAKDKPMDTAKSKPGQDQPSEKAPPAPKDQALNKKECLLECQLAKKNPLPVCAEMVELEESWTMTIREVGEAAKAGKVQKMNKANAAAKEAEDAFNVKKVECDEACVKKCK